MHKHPHISDAQLLEQSMGFFPEFSEGQRARWIAAKRYVAGRFTIPMGEKAVDNPLPDFLRALPRPQELHIERDTWDYVLEVKRHIESKIR